MNGYYLRVGVCGLFSQVETKISDHVEVSLGLRILLYIDYL